VTAADTTHNGGLRELALFAGAGGGILGGRLLGWRTVCAVEFDSYARSVLLARQRDGHLERFPIWDDVRTFDGHPWRGSVDVVSGGFPCQDISSAGKGAGIEGARSGLWGHMARIVREVRPRFVLVENSPMLTSRGLGVVLGDLASMGYDARWGVLGARHVGAPHRRDRIWIVACDADRDSEPAQPVNDEASRVPRVAWWDCDPSVANAACPDGKESPAPHGIKGAVQSGGGGGGECPRGRTPESVVGRVADGVADRVDRLRALGNGQVPAVAALAWTILSGGDP
jgi:DNA (cytosine-5)-methyltransferase 1